MSKICCKLVKQGF